MPVAPWISMAFNNASLAKHCHDTLSGYPESPLAKKQRYFSMPMLPEFDIPSPSINDHLHTFPLYLPTEASVPSMPAMDPLVSPEIPVDPQLLALEQSHCPSLNTILPPPNYSSCSSSALPTEPSASFLPSFEELHAQTHAHRLEMQDAITGRKTTGKIYECQVKNYEKWYKEEHSELSAHPVVATSVMLYLKYESTWLKVSMQIYD